MLLQEQTERLHRKMALREMTKPCSGFLGNSLSHFTLLLMLLVLIIGGIYIFQIETNIIKITHNLTIEIWPLLTFEVLSIKI